MPVELLTRQVRTLRCKIRQRFTYISLEVRALARCIERDAVDIPDDQACCYSY